MTGRVWHLATVVSFHLEAVPILPDSGLGKVRVLLEMAAIRVLMVAAVANSTTCAAFDMGRVRLILLA